MPRTRGDMPESVRELLPRLRDPEFTRVMIVILPEATPVHEAERLQGDLERAGIQPFAWVINQSLLASGTRDAFADAARRVRDSVHQDRGRPPGDLLRADSMAGASAGWRNRLGQLTSP